MLPIPEIEALEAPRTSERVLAALLVVGVVVALVLAVVVISVAVEPEGVVGNK